MLKAMNIKAMTIVAKAIRVERLDEMKVANKTIAIGPAAHIPHLTTNMPSD